MASWLQLLWLAAVLGAASVTNARAQTGAELRFLEVVGEVARAHPQARASARNMDAAAQDQQAARWQRFPSPSFQSLSPQGSAGVDKTNRLALEQPLYAGGRIDAGIAAADQRYNAGQHALAQVTQDTAIKVVNTWYEWRRQQDRIAVQQDGVQAHRKLREQIERRMREGVSTEIDLALAAARLSQMQAELAQSQSAFSAARAQLEQLAADQLPALMAAGQALQTEALPAPRADWTAQSLARDPLLARLQADEAAAEADIRVRQSQFLPTVSLVMDRYYSGPMQNQGQRTWVQLSMQPGAGLASLSAVRGAVARREAAAEARRNAELELQQTMATDLAGHASAAEQMGVAGLLRQSTQDVADSYARQFVAGRKSWLEVLNAVREAMQARLSVIDASAQLGQTAWRLHLRAFGLQALPGEVS
jgi:adhesin transport system outer membrane protein